MAKWRATSIDVGLDVKVFKLSGKWEPNDAERRAAWNLYVELITRIAVVELPSGSGLMREALTSLYQLFGATRKILVDAGPEVSRPKEPGFFSFAQIALVILNTVIRPTLAYWHPVLEDWEHQDTNKSRKEHEDEWSRRDDLRADLEAVRVVLKGYARLLAQACGAPDLTDPLPGQRQP